jgi:hypothetical protein
MHMRRAFLTSVIGLILLLPVAAQAKTATASAGGVTATLTYGNGAENNASTTSQQLLITEHGKHVYEVPVPATGCFKICTPDGKSPLHVASLYGDDGEDVVLTLFTGGADCCTVADVFVPSAAMHSYVLDQHNFGEDGFALKDIGPRGRPEFVSADPAFYCQFSACYASGLPLEIFEFEAERFIDVTRHHRGMIAADGARWLKLYYRNPAQGRGAIAAWAGDEDNLGYAATVRTVLQLQTADGHLTSSFVTTLEHFLAKHNYT